MDVESAKKLLSLNEHFTKADIDKSFRELASLENMEQYGQLAKARNLLLERLQTESVEQLGVVVDDHSETVETVKHLVSSTKNQIILGQGGTGKSRVILNFKNQIVSAGKTVIVCAFTGFAAMNVKGETIHSFFGFPAHSGLSLKSWDHLSPLARQKFQIIDVLVIDEVSMLSADCLDAIDKKLRAARNKKDIPFGGVRVVLLGDPYQLPPVPESKDKLVKAKMIEKYPMGNWFFEAEVYDEAEFEQIELVVNKRVNKCDSKAVEFEKALSEIRIGALSEDTMKFLNDRARKDNAKQDEKVFTIFPTRPQVAKFNSDKMAALPSETNTFRGSIHFPDPRRQPEYKNWPDDVAPQERLDLKIGARVMFIKNDDQGGEVTSKGKKRRWSNGDIGEVIAFKDADTILVSKWIDIKDDNNKDQEVLGEPFEVRRSTWEEVAHYASKRVLRNGGLKFGLDPHVIKTYTQFPLRLAWAITVHKSQGQTYEKMQFDPSGVFTHGQTYVAISRCRTIDGIQLFSEITPDRLIIDPAVTYFMANFHPIHFA